mgnify:CR=1 FL=1
MKKLLSMLVMASMMVFALGTMGASAAAKAPKKSASVRPSTTPVRKISAVSKKLLPKLSRTVILNVLLLPTSSWNDWKKIKASKSTICLQP